MESKNIYLNNSSFMKTFLLLTALLTFNASFAQTSFISRKNGPLEFVELDHGLAHVVKGQEEKLKNSPTGTHSWLDDFEITQVTDSIQATPKANFGVVYMIKAKDTADIKVEIEWIYPAKITNEKGEKFKSIKYSTTRPTNVPSASSYSLDAPYELVKGNWTMNIYIENKKVYSKTFFLY
jgi:Domain of unknown function (DUF3859)